MGHKITLSRQEFGDALVLFIGRKFGLFFFPYMIGFSTLKVPDTIEIELRNEPISPPSASPAEPTIGFISKETDISLTKDEIYEAITCHIDMFRFIKAYAGNRINSVSIIIPDIVDFKLEYVPRGSLSENCRHQL